MSETYVSLSALREEHEGWRGEHASWLTDSERWQTEHLVALETLKQVERSLLDHGAALEQHAKAVRDHDETIAAHEQALQDLSQKGDAIEIRASLLGTHRTLGAEHSSQERVHRRIAKQHVKRIRLIAALRNAGR